LQADRERKLNSRGRGGRWKIHPKQLEDMEMQKDELIEMSRRYWMRIFVKMKK
jgi:hypothetical protein